ncbi:unnamed protein product [Pleuronectes platessa]|uniref:Uncharacterized protein n=1 Tax=Pleuronectes platessa TaxID=8262 RepID=A0A9N7YCX4_PLEPL|nr:unnamed protein product [Pleuronectes platessa]
MTYTEEPLERSKLRFNDMSIIWNICQARRTRGQQHESGDSSFAKRWMRPTKSWPNCHPQKKETPIATRTKKHGSPRTNLLVKLYKTISESPYLILWRKKQKDAAP